MKAFAAFLRKELFEIVRTWRIWVLPGIVLFVALTGPPLARLTPQILAAVMPASSGVRIELPTPTYLDAYAQWVRNLTQMVTFALVIMWGGLVSGERRSGTAVLVLTKPLSRTAFILGKALSAAALLVATTCVGAAVTWGMTAAVFRDAPLGRLLAITGPWLAYAIFLLAGSYT
ncbi:MAG: ABC transporter permease, partial [Actinobacteria bacterium]